MTKLKINPQGTEEVVEIRLDPVKHPVAFDAKRQELVNAGMTRDEAERFILAVPFVMEVYYAPNQGLFLVESEAIESTDIHNPYDGEVVYNPENQMPEAS